jgi:hypothetical protein
MGIRATRIDDEETKIILGYTRTGLSGLALISTIRFQENLNTAQE